MADYEAFKAKLLAPVDLSPAPSPSRHWIRHSLLGTRAGGLFRDLNPIIVAAMGHTDLELTRKTYIDRRRSNDEEGAHGE